MKYKFKINWKGHKESKGHNYFTPINTIEKLKEIVLKCLSGYKSPICFSEDERIEFNGLIEIKEFNDQLKTAIIFSNIDLKEMCNIPSKYIGDEFSVEEYSIDYIPDEWKISLDFDCDEEVVSDLYTQGYDVYNSLDFCSSKHD